MTDQPDNLAAAVDQTGTRLGRRRSTGATDPTDTSQVLIRTNKESHERWKQAAEHLGISMAEFVRNAADKATSDLLDCPHGAEHRRWYPWAETCLRCGTQLRDRNTWLVNPANIPHVRPIAGNPAVR